MKILLHKSKSKLVVTIGTHDFDRVGAVHFVNNYTIHTNYHEGGFDNDIALIFIESGIQYNEYTNRVYLPQADPQSCEQFYFSFTGWGVVEKVSCC